MDDRRLSPFSDEDTVYDVEDTVLGGAFLVSKLEEREKPMPYKMLTGNQIKLLESLLKERILEIRDGEEGDKFTEAERSQVVKGYQDILKTITD